MPSTTSPLPTIQQQPSFSLISTPGAINLPQSQPSTQPILPAPTPAAVLAALPPPQTFDFIPQIHALVARLLLDPADKNALMAKDLVGEITVVKRQIAHAKGVLQGLPDIGRSIGEQEKEIEKAKARVERLRGLIAALGGDCRRGG